MKFLRLILLITVCCLGLYLALPTSGFPLHPTGSLFSAEPADTESVYRRAYFTNLTRSEIMDYYRKSFQNPFIRLNHPPENAYSLVRDQTQSSWLEELTHPLKDSIYVNGFYPTKPTEQININGTHYLAKITVKYADSHPITRLTVFSLILVTGRWLMKEYAKI